MSVEAKIADLEGRATASAVSQTLGPSISANEEAAKGESDYRGGAQADKEGAFQIENGKFINCFFMFGRRVITIRDQEISGDGMYCLIINHENPSASTVGKHDGSTWTEPSDLTTEVPLVQISDGIIVKDYRGMPVVPVYE